MEKNTMNDVFTCPAVSQSCNWIGWLSTRTKTEKKIKNFYWLFRNFIYFSIFWIPFFSFLLAWNFSDLGNEKLFFSWNFLQKFYKNFTKNFMKNQKKAKIINKFAERSKILPQTNGLFISWSFKIINFLKVSKKNSKKFL